MKGNVREVQQRLVVLLKKNSRISILDAADELGVSRITVKKAFDLLVNEKKIKNFTIITEEDDKNLAIVHLKDIEKVPRDLAVEYYTLLDGTFILVLYYENLPKINGLPIIDVKLATARELGNNLGRFENIHCDYCGKKIKESPIIFDIRGRTYYACCSNCERDLRKRRESILDKEKSGVDTS